MRSARCVDCHLPHEFVPKYIAKADNGYRHSKGFTFMDFHEPIMITPRNARTLQENCLRCHGDFVHDIVRGSTTRGGCGEVRPLPSRRRPRRAAMIEEALMSDLATASRDDARSASLAAIAGRRARSLVFLVAGLLTSIFERKQEARNPVRPPGRGQRGDDRSGSRGA